MRRMMIEQLTDPPALPARDPQGHKGTFGTVGVVGGCANARSGQTMVGGPVLSALASLRGGAGLARLALPEPMLVDALASAMVATGVALPVTAVGDPDASACAPRLDAMAGECDAIVVGPGLGLSAGATAIVHRLIGGGQEETPIVLDADGLNNLSGMADFAKELRAPCVVTPHVGEFRRLAEPLGIDAETGGAEGRLEAASRLAQRLGVVVVLKSSSTVVSDGLRAWVHEGGDARLATAGTGDVLSGVLASFVAQFHTRPILAGSRTVSSETRGGLGLFECARLAVSAHAGAARVWGEAHENASSGMLASDLLDALPVAIGRMRS